jgi:hypothetical protein
VYSNPGLLECHGDGYARLRKKYYYCSLPGPERKLTLKRKQKGGRRRRR